MIRTYGLVGLCCCLLSAGLMVSGLSVAGEADVLNVTITRSGNHQYDFSVTVRHDDSGWEHYASKWEIVDPAGNLLATRTLLHPHVGEQPFTRSLRSVAIPAGITTVKVRAYDSVHQYGGTEIRVALPQ